MTRVYAKDQKSATNAPVATATNNVNMSSAQPTGIVTPSPVPIRASSSTDKPNDSEAAEQDVSGRAETSEPRRPEPSQLPEELTKPDTKSSPPLSKEPWKAPSLAHNARLRIHFEDLTHPAVAKFLSVMPLSDLLQSAISNVQKRLFTQSGKHHSTSEQASHPPQTTPNPTATFFNPPASTTSSAVPYSLPPPQKPMPPPPNKPWTPQEVRAVTLIIRSMDGVAYTTGTDLDPSHKEIHLNIGYIEAIMKSNASKPDGDELFKYELCGVVTHEMVHVFQHDARSSCPGGLVEGIADYVRLKSGLGAKHWNPWPAKKDSRGEKWDEGYQKTAWFLTWVEEQVGKDCIGRLNFEMKHKSWDEGKVWKDVMGEDVKDMWKRYEGSWDEMNRKHEKEKDGGENGNKGVWL